MLKYLQKNAPKALILIVFLSLSFSLNVSAAGLEQGSSLCNKISEETSGFFSCGEEQTSLTDFKGQLNTPDASGYSPALVQATNVRDYIKNVVNFALGFLGILAVVIIIYGGFLYVTAAGEEDQAGKGKKTITYSVIGILIILASFAIVNTVLQAPSGKENTNLNGAAPNNGTVVDQTATRRAYFNYAAIALQTVAHDFVTAYQSYAEINIDIKSLENIDAEKDVKSPADLKSILQSKKNILVNMVNKAGVLSQVAEKSQKASQFLDQYIQTSDKKIVELAEDKEGKGWQQFWSTVYVNFQTEIKTNVEYGLQVANDADFALAIKTSHDKLAELYGRIHVTAPLPEIDAAFKVVFTGLNKLVALDNPVQSASILNSFASLFSDVAFADSQLLNRDAANNQNILEIVNGMGTLYEKVKDIQFVFAAIGADVVEGNGPLVVNFDGLKSLDPNKHTLPDSSYEWDFGDTSTNQGTAVGAATSWTYAKPGTYIVKLLVKAPKADTAKGEVQVANGVAYQTITVKPPSSRINLNVGINGTDFVMSEYDENGNQVKNIQDVTVTSTEATSGMIFDASRTKTGNNKLFSELTKSPVAKFRWDFGDKSNQQNMVEGAPDKIGQTQKIFYKNEGAYRVTLEVTDDRNITDRKIINVVVSSLAARINVEPGTELKLGDQAVFDASSSSSNNGQIKTYTWKVTKKTTGGAEKDVTPAEIKNTDNLKYKFTEAGAYNVNLTVNDGSKEASSDVSIDVESKPPVAQFTFNNPDKTQPNTFILDASTSYDPDGNEDLAYQWELNAAPGDCAYIIGTVESDCSLSFKDFSTDKKLIKPKFKFKKGTYTATLNVEDPAEPGKRTTQEHQIIVDNELDVGWGDDGKPITVQLKDGDAEVSFSLKSSKGISYELDTGDGEKESGTINNYPMVVKHTYTKSGQFKAKLKVFDDQDNENITSRKIYIGSADTPIAAVAVTMDGEDLSDTTQTIVANRKSVFAFDAKKSLNTDGTGRSLIYSWDFGDGTKSTQKQVTHIFKELTPQGSDFYKVTLKVSNADNASQVSPLDEIHINIVKQSPVIQGLTVIPLTGNLVTPVTVSLSANGANDPDGKIVTYRWWYYDVNAPDDQLGLQITQTPSTTLTVGTNGEEKLKKTYGFAVIATDDENQMFNTKEDLNENIIPTLSVVNGPNKAPTAKFNVDRTSIMVGENINFASSSTDPNPAGTIVKYIWDFNGNGFGDDTLNNDYNKANVTYTYKTPSKDGIRVRVKVINNNGAEATSDPVTIYVDAKSGPPTAAFIASMIGQQAPKKVQLTNNSTADEASGANLKKYLWDFDVNNDSNGDGIKDNDIDSTEQSPVHEYADYGVYRTKLSVEDDQGNKTSITNFVNVKNLVPTEVVVTPTAQKLEARLTSVPAPNAQDSRIHLQGDKGTIIFNFSDSKGEIVSYVIDKNIYFDSNGNGIKDDDEDYKVSLAGTWIGQFAKSDGLMRVRLTIFDASGKKSSVEKDVMFDLPLPTKSTNPTSGLGL